MTAERIRELLKTPEALRGYLMRLLANLPVSNFDCTDCLVARFVRSRIHQSVRAGRDYVIYGVRRETKIKYAPWLQRFVHGVTTTPGTTITPAAALAVLDRVEGKP